MTARTSSEGEASTEERGAARRGFIAQAGWEAAAVAPLDGDASNRRYFRLTHPRLGAAMLMDAPPELGEDVRPFAAVTGLLRGWGFGAPEVLAADLDAGFLLLEDLGDALFARVVARDAAAEPTLYEAAVDLLAALAERPAPPLAAGYGAVAPIRPYDRAALFREADLLPLWYAPSAPGDAEAADWTAAFRERLAEAVAPVAEARGVLVLRDYHAENLIWQGDARGGAQGRDRVRLLDYQDALRGHGAYDLVSLLEDARRDVPPALAEAMIARYLDRTGLAGADAEAFRIAYATLGAQRNLKIVGIFARLALRDGKPRYLDLIPRVWGLLMRDLAHPALASLREAVLALAPAPEPAVLDALRARAGARAQTAAAPASRLESPTDTAMILAAGLGTRMRPLTEATPKPLLRVGDAPLIDHAMRRAAEVGARRFVVNTHYLGAQVRAHLAALEGEIADEIVISDESDALLETGGGVARALPLIDRAAFLVVNSDSFWLGPRALAPLVEGWDPADMDALLLLTPTARTMAHARPGDFRLTPEARLERRGGAASAPFVYSGAQILKASLFEDAPAGAFSLNRIWDAAIAQGRAYGVIQDAPWVDVGTPEGLAQADALAKAESTP